MKFNEKEQYLIKCINKLTTLKPYLIYVLKYRPPEKTSSGIITPEEYQEAQMNNAQWGKLLGMSPLNSTNAEINEVKKLLHVGDMVSFQPGHPVMGFHPEYPECQRCGVKDILEIISEEDFKEVVVDNWYKTPKVEKSPIIHTLNHTTPNLIKKVR